MVIFKENIIKTLKEQKRKINFPVSFGVSELRKDKLEGWFKLLTQGECCYASYTVDERMPL